MHFYFAGQEELGKLPAQEYWQKQLTARTKQPMARHAIPVTAAYRSITEHP